MPRPPDEFCRGKSRNWWSRPTKLSTVLTRIWPETIDWTIWVLSRSRDLLEHIQEARMTSTAAAASCRVTWPGWSEFGFCDYPNMIAEIGRNNWTELDEGSSGTSVTEALTNPTAVWSNIGMSQQSLVYHLRNMNYILFSIMNSNRKRKGWKNTQPFVVFSNAIKR